MLSPSPSGEGLGEVGASTALEEKSFCTETMVLQISNISFIKQKRSHEGPLSENTCAVHTLFSHR